MASARALIHEIVITSSNGCINKHIFFQFEIVVEIERKTYGTLRRILLSREQRFLRISLCRNLDFSIMIYKYKTNL